MEEVNNILGRQNPPLPPADIAASCYSWLDVWVSLEQLQEMKLNQNRSQINVIFILTP